MFSLPKHTVTTSFHVLTGVYPALVTNNVPYKSKRKSNDESVSSNFIQFTLKITFNKFNLAKSYY